MRIAAQQAVSLIVVLQETVAGHRAARLAGRVRRHRDAPAPTPGFVLGARLDGDGTHAADGPTYLKGADSDGDEDDQCGAAPSWDDVAPAVAFPFAGPLLPSADKHDAHMDTAEIEAPGAHEPVRARASRWSGSVLTQLTRRPLRISRRKLQNTTARFRCLKPSSNRASADDMRIACVIQTPRALHGVLRKPPGLAAPADA